MFNCCLDYPIFYPIIVLSGKAVVLGLETQELHGLSRRLVGWGAGGGEGQRSDSDVTVTVTVTESGQSE